jgi:chorismate mutase
MKNELKTFRRRIDKIDNKIVALLEKRFEVSRKIRR